MQAMELSDGGDKSLSQSTFTQHLGRLAGTFANTAFWSSSLFSPLTPTATVLNKHKPSSHSVTLTQSPPHLSRSFHHSSLTPATPSSSIPNVEQILGPPNTSLMVLWSTQSLDNPGTAVGFVVTTNSNAPLQVIRRGNISLLAIFTINPTRSIRYPFDHLECLEIS